MNSYEIVKRTKLLIASERKSLRKAKDLAQLQRKYEEQIAQSVQLADKLYRQKRLLMRQPLRNYEQRNEEMTSLLTNMQQLVEEQRAMHEQLEKEKQQQLCLRKKNHVLMDTLQMLEGMTGLYIKFESLPERIQGVAVRRREDSEKWTHLDINPLKHTLEHVQDLIWQKIEHDENNVDYRWTQLFFEPTNTAISTATDEVICID